MQRNSPVRKPHTSTADLLTWSENPSLDSLSLDSSTPGSRPTIRTHQPAGGISRVLFGGQMTDEEVESLLKSSMKDGYETYCGERGTQLSGVHKQRIALA